LNVEAKN